VPDARLMPADRREPFPGLLSKLGALTLAGGLWLLCCLAAGAQTSSVTLEELRTDPALTPERLIKQFSDFKFQPGREVRQPGTFLEQKAGDCDDFATLASDVLRAHGYSTRLVAVYMPNEVHVVCYVGETSSYLDFNRRKKTSPLVKCKSDLAAIAASVAGSFRAQWRSASEFTFKNGARRFVATVFR
jgi:hypothetical protein